MGKFKRSVINKLYKRKLNKYKILNPYLETAKAELEVEKYGFNKKSNIKELALIAVLLGLVSFIIWVIIVKFGYQRVQWSQAFTAILSLGIAIIAYRQWRAARHEISIDKYYDRLEVVNKRMESLETDKPSTEDMYVFAELDKLEYVIVKYEYGFISPVLALRALENFKALCNDRRGFNKKAFYWVYKAAYRKETRQVAKIVCEKCSSELHLVRFQSDKIFIADNKMLSTRLNQMRFSNKVCLVTGGGSGIGRATCNLLAIEGGKVVVVDIDEEGGNQTVKNINATGGQAIFVKADVSVSAEVQAAVEVAQSNFGKIDVLVNNAAMMTFKRVVDLTEDEWDRVLAVNLRSVFLFCKYSLPHMERGAIVNVSSIHAHETEANLAPYAASKGGLEAFTRALSREYKSSNIRINCVAPVGVNTPMLWSNPAIKKMNPQDVEYSQPEQIAAVICFLASDEASTINGATIIADMGLLSAL